MEPVASSPGVRDNSPGTRSRSAQHYDPDNVGFGSLVCHDDHLLGPGVGFDEHPHRDLEIVTWVLSGALQHSDSSGHTGVVRPGEVQVLSAGSGVTHSEIAGPDGPTRFVQAWLTPDSLGRGAGVLGHRRRPGARRAHRGRPDR